MRRTQKNPRTPYCRELPEPVQGPVPCLRPIITFSTEGMLKVPDAVLPLVQEIPQECIIKQPTARDSLRVRELFIPIFLVKLQHRAPLPPMMARSMTICFHSVNELVRFTAKLLTSANHPKPSSVRTITNLDYLSYNGQKI